MGYLPRSVVMKRKCGRRKLSQPQGITGVPILDFKLLQTRKKENHCRPTDCIPERKKKARVELEISRFEMLLSCCLPLPPVKHDPYKAQPQCAPEPTQPAVDGNEESLEKTDD